MAQETKGNAYESWYNSFEGKKEGKFMTWYHSYKGKSIVNIVYSVGASVVIVGALFKILHWPGASSVLMIGMFTEAFLFIIGALEAPHEEFHWGNVFPQLIEYGSPDERVARSREQLGCAPVISSDEKKEEVKKEEAKQEVATPKLSDKDMEALAKSIKDLAGTAEQLSTLGKVAESTNKLSAKAEAAAEAAGQFAEAANALGQKNDKLGESYEAVAKEMSAVVDNTKHLGKGVNDVTAKLSSINSIYELQLAAVQAHNDALKAETAEVNAQTKQIKAVGEQFAAVNDKVVDMAKSVDEMKKANEAALKNQQAYEEATKKLAAQVADLNKIYGNMLGALA